MPTPSLPPNEAERLSVLAQQAFASPALRQACGDLVRLAASACGVPLAAISVVERDRQWFSATHGFAVGETPRDEAFCAHTIQGSTVLEIPDAAEHPSLRTSRLVLQPPHVRFYAGVPLLSREGLALGALCVMHSEAASLTDGQRNALSTLGRHAAAHFDLHRSLQALAEDHIELRDRLNAGEDALEESYQALTDIGNLLPLSLVVTRKTDGTLLYANDTFRETFGLPPGTGSGLRSTSFYMDRKDREDLLAGLEGRGMLRDRVVELRRWDETPFPAAVSMRLVRFAGEDALVSTVHDLTLLREAEEAKVASHRHFRELLEAVANAVVVVDDDGKVGFVNRAAVRVFGYAESEIVGLPVEVLVPGAVREDHVVHCRRFHTAGEGRAMGSGLEIEGVHRDGRRIPIDVSLRPVSSNGSRLVVCTVRDLTEQKLLEARLMGAQRLEAVGRLAGGVAHDFNNLIQVILTEAELLLDVHAPPEEAREGVAAIVAVAARAGTLTKQLLAFSRRQVLEPALVDLSAAVRNLDRILARLLGEGIHVRCDLAEGLPAVFVDLSQVEQVVVNLAVNARDAMPSGGELTIGTGVASLEGSAAASLVGGQSGDYVVLTMKDTGVGMDRETMKRIFEPFFTTKEMGSGTGLGLATVYGIVKQSEGHMWVDSHPGEGTTFSIYFPVAEDAPARPSEAPAPRSGPRSAEGAMVLVVEDDEAVRRLICRVLRSDGLEVLEAGSLAEAESLATRHGGKIRLLLTDIVLPGDNGDMVAEIVQRFSPEVKALFMSGYPEDEVTMNRLLQRGVEWIPKPFSIQTLLESVRNRL